ncbi:MAG: hypothetical protein H6626_09630 [Pseudobdellovibrionaceae bacterium]|nr:hypothetical protein [Bdellovibrionales bacterium]USN46475.1 MAG: hypothetical protein H6626_09630 [Pseudobdellovibrionaceae bacterium]
MAARLIGVLFVVIFSQTVAVSASVANDGQSQDSHQPRESDLIIESRIMSRLGDSACVRVLKSRDTSTANSLLKFSTEVDLAQAERMLTRLAVEDLEERWKHHNGGWPFLKNPWQAVKHALARASLGFSSYRLRQARILKSEGSKPFYAVDAEDVASAVVYGDYLRREIKLRNLSAQLENLQESGANESSIESIRAEIESLRKEIDSLPPEYKEAQERISELVQHIANYRSEYVELYTAVVNHWIQLEILYALERLPKSDFPVDIEELPVFSVGGFQTVSMAIMERENVVNYINERRQEMLILLNSKNGKLSQLEQRYAKELRSLAEVVRQLKKQVADGRLSGEALTEIRAIEGHLLAAELAPTVQSIKWLATLVYKAEKQRRDTAKNTEEDDRAASFLSRAFGGLFSESEAASTLNEFETYKLIKDPKSLLNRLKVWARRLLLASSVSGAGLVGYAAEVDKAIISTFNRAWDATTSKVEDVANYLREDDPTINKIAVAETESEQRELWLKFVKERFPEIWIYDKETDDKVVSEEEKELFVERNARLARALLREQTQSAISEGLTQEQLEEEAQRRSRVSQLLELIREKTIVTDRKLVEFVVRKDEDKFLSASDFISGEIEAPETAPAIANLLRRHLDGDLSITKEEVVLQLASQMTDRDETEKQKVAERGYELVARLLWYKRRADGQRLLMKESELVQYLHTLVAQQEIDTDLAKVIREALNEWL